MSNEAVANIEKVFPDLKEIEPLFICPDSGDPISVSAKREETGDKVVVKIINKHHVKAATDWMNNPQDGMAKILDVNEGEGESYLVREWLDGQSLLKILIEKKDLIGDFFTLFCISSSLGILSNLHNKKIVHGQLKPANFIFSEGNLILTDPCLAANPWDNSEQEDRSGYVEQTTPHYQNPEWIKNLTLKPASDIYSIGTILHHLLFHKPPFADPNPLLVCFKHLNENPTIPEGELTDLQQTMWPLIYRMLAKDPEERPENAVKCLDEFEKLASHSKGVVDIQTIKLETGKLFSSDEDDKPILITESTDVIPVSDGEVDLQQQETTYIKTVALSREELLASVEKLNPVVSEEEDKPESYKEMHAVSEAETIAMSAVKDIPDDKPVKEESQPQPQPHFPPYPEKKKSSLLPLYIMLAVMLAVCVATVGTLVYILLVRYNMMNL